MNLVYKYNPLYWACACLTVNAGAIVTEEEVENNEEDVEEDNRKSKTTNYDKTAKAIGTLKTHGVVVSTPNINKAVFSFEPDIQNNVITYSLKAINGLSDETASKIVSLRGEGYKDFNDFLTKVEPKKTEVYALIKAGSFDEFNPNRFELMKEFVRIVVGVKANINGQNLSYLVKNNIIPQDYALETRIYRYKQYIYSKEFFYCIDEKTSKNKKPHKWFKLNKISTDFFNQYIITHCDEGVHYDYTAEGEIIILDSKLNKVLDSLSTSLTTWLKTEEAVDVYNRLKLNEEWSKYCLGSIERWEMESLCFYVNQHELFNVDNDRYMFEDFFTLSETPIKVGEYTYKKRTYDMVQLSRIVGTVVGKDNTKHIVYLLTASGVVSVKMYEGAYSHYNKQISKVENNKKTVLEKPWIKRGNILAIVGFRREDQFIPKTYKNSIHQHTVQKVNVVMPDGTLILQEERIKA